MDKRIQLGALLFFMLCFAASIDMILIAKDLIFIESYSEFISLMDISYFQWSYFVRVILENLNYANVSILHILYTCIDVVNVFDFLFLVGLLFIFCFYDLPEIKPTHRALQAILASFLLGYLLSLSILFFGFQATSLGDAIGLFTMIGVVLLIAHSLMACFSLVGIYTQIRCFQKA